MRSMIAALSILFVVFSTGVSPAQDKNLGKAMRAVFNGPQAKKLKVRGHHFNVKKARISVRGGVVTVKGQISHCLRLRPDDQVYYTIRKKGDKVLSVRLKIKRGGAKKLIKWAAKGVELVTGRSIPIEKAMSFLSRADKRLGKGWEGAARYIVTAVAVRVDAKGKDGGSRRDHRKRRRAKARRRNG